MIDKDTSAAILRHLKLGIGGLKSPETDTSTLDGFIAAKTGFFPEWPHCEYLHEALYFKNKESSRELVVVILSKRGTFRVVKPLFEDLVTKVLSAPIV